LTFWSVFLKKLDQNDHFGVDDRFDIFRGRAVNGVSFWRDTNLARGKIIDQCFEVYSFMRLLP